MIKIIVNDNDIAVTSDPKYCLVAEGVSTSICLLARGKVGNVPYLAMYYWDGFSASFDKSSPNAHAAGKAVIEGLMCRYASVILQYMQSYNPKQRNPSLDALCCVGGEKEVPGMLSGTELEVDVLQTYAPQFCGEFFITSSDTTYAPPQAYLTQGANSVTVSFDFENHVTLMNEDGEPLQSGQTLSC